LFVRKFPHSEAGIPPLHFPVWRTLVFRPCPSAAEYASMLKEGKRKAGAEVISTFAQLPLRTEEISLDLFCLSVSTLGFSMKGAHYDELLPKAAELGLTQCPADTALQISREYADQPRRQELRVIAPPVMSRNAPHIYRLLHEPPGQRWLGLETALDPAHFGPNTLFVLARA
jgi:hypothetical protein